MAFLTEFKKFATRGNMIDMAVGIIIGAAFGSIITSLVNDVIMPPIGLLLGKVDFADLSWTLQEKTTLAPAVVIKYGVFLNTIISFLIIAFVVFLVIKQVNRLQGPEVIVSKQCPFCDSTISLKSQRCPHCTSTLSDEKM